LPEGASPEIIQEKQKKADEVMEKLRGGADFQETAVAVSESRQALEGGDLGWRKAGEIPSLFAAEVATMKPNDIRGPLRNASGFHIIKLAASRGGSQVTVTQTHARHILIKTSETVPETEARNKLQQIRTRLENGEDFATLARANSEDPGSASQGGDLGWVSPGTLVDEFEEIMDKLAVDEISQPFKTTYGWHVVQILGRRQHDNTSEALRNRAAKQIRQRKIEEELQSWLRQLREESYVEYRLDEG
jgi:peptidyl-prolyl cis-trans isomerase SurA